MIGNAIKFTSQGNVMISVTTESRSQNHVVIKFCVKDTGIGISEKALSQLFQPFHQADTSITRKYGGTGLGLSICFRLVQMMGGKIWADSILEKGSRFFFTIKSTVAHQESHKPILNHIASKRVLIVDKNENSCQALIRTLTKWQMECHIELSGDKAIARLVADKNFDLVILDINTPVIDGITLGKTIRGLFQHKKIPIILLNSTTFVEGHENNKIFSAVLRKPVRLSLLQDTLVKLFDKTSLQEKYSSKKTANYISEAKHTKTASQNRLQIMVAEDVITNQKIVGYMLKSIGYDRIDFVSNGVEAINAMRHKTYDVIFMDINMPEMGGVEATHYIRQNFPEEKQPKIIALTADAILGKREKYLKCGMDYYLSKPVRPEQIKKVLLECSETL
ncbi:MAG: hypothetical protein OMM_08605 [Candidatus Magnetoglobus multicellularis str. Araruama]|uniref:histidine kinase n=1 Tax=Candidatus Magnetoglobus multicellularis str. Araruama TaxID=890399 RepID=A0A1V1P750_9BACT|nr:MAG: hypothetical protein OMM_08605 [Candidatus Magnetoglobus multicellularis str. Araruama]